jgi:hypothetical protein
LRTRSGVHAADECGNNGMASSLFITGIRALVSTRGVESRADQGHCNPATKCRTSAFAICRARQTRTGRTDSATDQVTRKKAVGTSAMVRRDFNLVLLAFSTARPTQWFGWLRSYSALTVTSMGYRSGSRRLMLQYGRAFRSIHCHLGIPIQVRAVRPATGRTPPACPRSLPSLLSRNNQSDHDTRWRVVGDENLVVLIRRGDRDLSLSTVAVGRNGKSSSGRGRFRSAQCCR